MLKKINEKTKCVVQMTLTTADEVLCKKIEPGVCTTARRFEVLKEMRDAGIPTVVWLEPILPFINDTDENIQGVLDMCIEAKVCGIMHDNDWIFAYLQAFEEKSPAYEEQLDFL